MEAQISHIQNDACSAVCLFLDTKPIPAPPKKEVKEPEISVVPEEANVLEHSGTIIDSSEIVPYVEAADGEVLEKDVGRLTRSLAECISSTEDEELSALEGMTRVNSLLSIPLLLSGDK